METVATGTAVARGRWPRMVAAAAVSVIALALGGSACAGGSPSTSSEAARPAAAPGVGAGDGDGQSGEAATDQATGSPDAAGAPSLNTDALGAAVAQPVGSFISTATMTVEVDDVSAAKPKVLAVAQEEGGALFAEETSFSRQSRSTITIKVPPAAFNRVLERLAGLGTLASQQVKTDDVTQRVIDLDSRIAAGAESLERVKGLLGEATSITDIAYLENEVTRRQSDLESLRGQKKTLQSRIDLATVVVTLDGGTADVTPAERERQEEIPGFRDGLREGWELARKLAILTSAVVGAILPFVPLLVVLVLGLRWLGRRGRRQAQGGGTGPTGGRPAPPPPPAPPASPAAEARSEPEAVGTGS